MASLGSKWTGLNPVLLGTLYAVDRKGSPIGGDEVVAPITGMSVEFSGNWQSPFEQMGPESRAPTIAAVAQSGMAGDLLTKLFGDSGAESAQKLVKEMQGRSGVTKLNSTQIFAGAPPVKIPLTMHFRAHSDPDAEVMAPIDQLIRWVLSEEMAPHSAAVNFLEFMKGERGAIAALFPSRTPPMVGLRFRGTTYAPLVIESMPVPTDVPCDARGRPISAVIQMQLATLTALDQSDWLEARAGRPTKLT